MGVIRLATATLLATLLLAPVAHAATVSGDAGLLRIGAAPGEVNAIEIDEGPDPSSVTVADSGAPIVPGGLCAPGVDPDAVVCPRPARVEADLGDGDDSLSLYEPLPAIVRGGPGLDAITGGDADDTIDGGPGADVIGCGGGRDRAAPATVDDEIDVSCEAVDYGRAGQVGPIRARTGGGRFVPVPGQAGTRVDRRVLPDLLYLVRRYHLRLGDGYRVGGNHKTHGEHPLGRGVDIYPGAGGSWNSVDRLARWAEPRQNHPRMPFRWVGYNGDENHGRGNHLHLSWSHTPGRPGRPVRSVWTWTVSPAAF